jgi:hypothetical protein
MTFFNSGFQSPTTMPFRPHSSQTRRMQEMIDKYGRSHNIQDSLRTSTPPHIPNVPSTILLTGPTGNLGTDILALLLLSPSVRKIYAFNRPSKEGSVRDRIAAKFQSKGLNSALKLLFSDRFVALEGDLRRDDLGLEANQLQEVITLVLP